jgi:glutamate:GABA antiporter
VSTSMADNTASDPGGFDSDAASRGLFVRKSSGLVRDIGLSSAFGLNLGFLNVGGGLGVFAIMFSLFPQGNVPWVLVIGGGLVGLIGVPYAQLATTMPRSGGDYVYQSRIFHPLVGAWLGVAFLLFLLYLMGSSLVFWTSSFLPYIFGTLATALHVSWLSTLATDMATHTGQLLASLLVLAITIGLIGGGVQLAGRG